jgi:hypothetical protein
VRDRPRRFLIRSLFDVRLSRLAMLTLAALSGVATVVIVTSGGTQTPAQVAALAALHQGPVTVLQATPPAAATTPAASVAPSTGSGAAGGAGAGAGSGGSGSLGASGSSGSSGASGSTGAPGSGSSDDGSGDASTTTNTTSTTSTTTTAATDLPPIKHVFEIALSTTTYAAAFGHTSAAPYLRSLEKRGTLLSGYESLGRGELADELAGVSGQAPNADTSAGCGEYAEFPHSATAKADGVVSGNGCIFPETALTVGDQVSASGHTWKAYVADMGSQTCSHPNSDAADDVALPGTQPGYDTRHNPFIYFHSLLDLGDCASDDMDLSRLPGALSRASGQATFSYIAPGACADATAVAAAAGETADPAAATSTTTATSTTAAPGATTSTTTSTSTTTGDSTTTPAAAPLVSATGVNGCPAGQPTGIAAENAFLAQWVPKITASSAYRHDGALIVAFAGTRAAGRATRTGAVVLSPDARRDRTVTTAYGPYALLRSVEEMLGDTALAHAAKAPSFAAAVLAAKTK